MSKRPERRLPPNDALQQTIEYGAPMPAFDDNPTNWESRMKARMKGRPILNRFKISKQSMNLTILIGEVFQNVRAADKMGSEDAVWTEYYKLLKRYVRTRRQAMVDNAEYIANRKEATEYASRLNVPPTIITQYLMGINGKPFDVEFFKKRFDKWVQDNPQGLPDTSRCYDPGFMPDIVAATKTEQEYKAKLDAQNEQSRREFAAITEGRDVDDEATAALNQRLNALAAEQSGDELTEGVKDDWGPFWVSLKHMTTGLDIPYHKDYVHMFFNVTSAKDTGKTKGEMLTELKKHFDAVKAGTEKLLTKNAPEAASSQPSAPPVPVPPPAQNGGEISSVKPVSSKGNEQMPESPIVVYPMQSGSIVYKGIRFSVTLRLGGNFMMALKLMEEFVIHADLIDPSCKVAQPATAMPLPSNTTALPTTPPQAAQPTSGEADGKGRRPGGVGSSVVTGVEKSKKNGKTIVELWASGKFAEHSLKLDSEHAMIEALGYSVDKMEIGTRYPINWTADWVVSGNRANEGKGNYYLNVTGIRDNGAALPKAS